MSVGEIITSSMSAFLRDPLLPYFAGLFLCLTIYSCWYTFKAFDRVRLTDRLTYGDGKPPTLRRIVFSVCLIFGVATFGMNLTAEEFFVFNRPETPIINEGRVYPLFVHGTTVYLTRHEHWLASNAWLAVFAACFFIIGTIRMDGDPFGSELGDTPPEALPRNALGPAIGNSSLRWVLLILLVMFGAVAAVLIL